MATTFNKSIMDGITESLLKAVISSAKPVTEDVKQDQKEFKTDDQKLGDNETKVKLGAKSKVEINPSIKANKLNQINELSQSLLGRYKDKAEKDYNFSKSRRDYAEKHGVEALKRAYTNQHKSERKELIGIAKNDYAQADIADKEMKKRSSGIKTASKKLTKEDIEIAQKLAGIIIKE